MIQKFFTLAFGSAVDLFYPPQCVLCNKALTGKEKYICNDCFDSLPLISGPHCPKCSRPIRTRNGENQLCGICRIQPDKNIKITVAAAEYQGLMKRLIHLYKYERQQFLSKFFAHIIVEQIKKKNIESSFDLLVPIPLHWTRKRWRGFNQARELCRNISPLINVPIVPESAFCRVRRTTPQVQLNAASRTANIRGAFAVRKNKYIKDKNIALVDDVYTTGATSGECSRMLLGSGAKSVSLLIIAR
ncbi:MAG: ComF family protein [Chlamydiae bacterium]|nr:MAG: ComF family protein [Chlamydiota bacterium]